MRVEHVNRYAAPVPAVHEMLTDPAFREEVCRRQHALEHQVEVVSDGARTTVTVDRTQSMAKAPGVAIKIVGDRVRVVQRETWTGPTGAELLMEIPGKPGHLTGTIALRDNGDGTTDEVFSGEVKVHVPLLGGRLEKLVADVLVRALRREGEVGTAWLLED